MKHYTAEDTALLWGISPQMVRRYCREGKVPNAVHTEQSWMIPEGTMKPGTEVLKETPQTPLVKKILYQRERNNHFGIYEYIQVNLTYSSNRMASNRLTREQVIDLFRTNKVSVSFEPIKSRSSVGGNSRFQFCDFLLLYALLFSGFRVTGFSSPHVSRFAWSIFRFSFLESFS